MADGSTRVVYAALLGNVLVALSKFGAALISGSSSMLTEAVHSTTDITNQLVLLLGNRRSRAPPDDMHDFGHGLEMYYYTFVVAIMILLAGGLFSLYTGWSRVRAPEPITNVSVTFGVLVLSAVFEFASFAVGYRQYRRVAATHVIPGFSVGLWTFIKLSKDPNLYESLLEDGAALIGLGLAAAGVSGTLVGFHWADGAASMAIGVLLVANSYVVLAATKSLMGGEAVAPPLRRDIQKAVDRTCGSLRIGSIKTLHLGPRTILLSLSIDSDANTSAATIRDELRRLREQLRAVDPRIRYVLVDVG